MHRIGVFVGCDVQGAPGRRGWRGRSVRVGAFATAAAARRVATARTISRPGTASAGDDVGGDGSVAKEATADEGGGPSDEADDDDGVNVNGAGDAYVGGLIAALLWRPPPAASASAAAPRGEAASGTCAGDEGAAAEGDGIDKGARRVRALLQAPVSLEEVRPW